MQLQLDFDLDAQLTLYWALSYRVDELWERALKKGDCWHMGDWLGEYFQATAELYVWICKEMGRVMRPATITLAVDDTELLTLSWSLSERLAVIHAWALEDGSMDPTSVFFFQAAAELYTQIQAAL